MLKLGKEEDQLLVFERLIHVVHEHAPKARLAFNAGPKGLGGSGEALGPSPGLMATNRNPAPDPLHPG
jgi:hypothetical protein